MTRILLVHGTFGDAGDWDATRKALKTLGALQKLDAPPTTALTLPGHGGRALAPDRDAFEQLVDAVDDAIDAPCILVGYSLGGRAALHAVLRMHPKRRALIQALALEGADPGITDPEARRARAALDQDRAADVEAQDLRVFLDRWYQQPLFGPIATDAEARQRLVEARAERAHTRDIARIFRECSPGRVRDLWPKLAALRDLPMHFIHGEHDARYTQIGVALQAVLPQLQCHRIPDAGHNSHLEQPKAFAKTLLEIAQRRGPLRRTSPTPPTQVKREEPVSEQEHVPDTELLQSRHTRDISPTFWTEEVRDHTQDLRESQGRDARSPSPATATAKDAPSAPPEGVAGPAPHPPHVVDEKIVQSALLTYDAALGPVLWHAPPLLALYKESGLLVHNSAFAGPRETTLLDLARAQHAGPVFPLHRIDRGTSGLVLAVDAQDATPDWMAALRDDSCVREYLAITRGHLGASVRVERPVPNSDGELRDAASVIEPLRHSAIERLSLVRVRIFTGRHHQARRHCRSIGHPILGDATWGNSKFNRALRASQRVDRLCLHSWRVIIERPDGGRHDLCAPPDANLDAICQRLFDTDAAYWRSLAAQPPLREQAALIYRADDDKPQPMPRSTEA